MIVVHNAINQVQPKKPATSPAKRSNWAKKAMYKSYQDVIKARESDIKLIQEYFPGWLPKFDY